MRVTETCHYILAVYFRSASKILARQPDLIDKSGKSGHTPLHVAAINENMDVAKLLIKVNKSPNEKCYNTSFVYCHELGPGTVSFTGNWVRGDDSKQNSYYKLRFVFVLFNNDTFESNITD